MRPSACNVQRPLAWLQMSLVPSAAAACAAMALCIGGAASRSPLSVATRCERSELSEY